MSFLKQATQFGGIGAALNPNGAAQGLGHLLNISPLGISRFADTIGNAANGIANAGGASAGYQGQQQAPNNYLQMLDPDVLKSILAKFSTPGPGSSGGYAR